MGSETHVGALLRKARKGLYRGAVGWREIDRELDLRKSTVEHWEAGRVQHLPIAQVMALADYLQIPLEDLRAAAIKDANALRVADAGTSANPPASIVRGVDESADAMADRSAALARHPRGPRTRRTRNGPRPG
jgi:hypothetical protein